MKSLLTAVLVSLLCVTANAQTRALGTVLGNQTVIPIPTAPTGYAITAQALIYYPDDYFLAKNATKKYPMFVFLHGMGEGASQDIKEVLNQSLPYLIAAGLKPYSIDPDTKDTVKWIVVSPHCASCGGSYSYPQLQYTIPYLMTTYRVDTTCMWVGGLSSGGRGTFSMPMGNVVGDSLWGKRLAGIMPMANGGYDNRTDLFPNLATSMKGGLSALYVIGDQDPGYNAAGFGAYDNLMKTNAQSGRYFSKVIVGGTHSANVWNTPFPMNARVWSTTMNSWDQMWTLRRKKSTTVVATPPAVPAGIAIPGTVQAESYSSMSGVATQATSDAGGGTNVGWIDKGDYMDYYVTVSRAGTYTVSLRYATSYTNAGIQIRNSSGTVLAMIAPKTTGGFQAWGTATASIKLPAGNQTLRVYSVSSNWNFNWMSFAFVSATSASGDVANGQANQFNTSSAAIEDGSAAEINKSVLVYPNPVSNDFTLRLSNSYNGKIQVNIVDVLGAVRRTYNYSKESTVLQTTVNVTGLAPGTYFVRIQSGSGTQVQKILKL